MPQYLIEALTGTALVSALVLPLFVAEAVLKWLEKHVR